jgi:hypothetical protein
VARSKNGTFLFDRGYMDYHADRFEDHSLVASLDGEPVALLPANRDGATLVSHAGLTYGGFVVDQRMTTPRMLEIFDAAVAFARRSGFESILYKCVPHIYHRQPAEEDEYALFRLDAQRWRADVSSTIWLPEPLPPSSARRRWVKKAEKANLQIVKSHDFERYFDLVARTLQSRYDTRPVHTAAEMKRLAERFGDNIALYCAHREEQLLAGAIVYDCGPCVHAQYLANEEEGRALGALDLVLHTLITRVYADRRWFDLGRSTEQVGRYLNEGLIRFKEMLGARATVYNTYRVDVR